MTEPRIGLYPGTFDPVTNGHMDIIQRASRLVDRLIVAIAANDGKAPLFPLEDRTRLLREEIDNLDPALGKRIDVRPFDTLLIDFARRSGASVILRGLRAISDFEYEFQMAGMNARLDPQIDTVFLMSSERHQFISSRFVKEIARLGGDVSSFVSQRVHGALRQRLANQK